MVAKLSKFGKKRSSVFENVIAAIVFVVICVGLIGFFIFQNVTIGQKRGDLEDRLQELQAQAAALEAQKAQLEEDAASTQTEEYQEKVLREQGLYQKEGEEVVTVLPPEGTSETVEEEQANERTWWKPWTW